MNGPRYSLKHKQDTPVSGRALPEEGSQNGSSRSSGSSGGHYDKKEFGEKLYSTAERGR